MQKPMPPKPSFSNAPELPDTAPAANPIPSGAPMPDLAMNTQLPVPPPQINMPQGAAPMPPSAPPTIPQAAQPPIPNAPMNQVGAPPQANDQGGMPPYIVEQQSDGSAVWRKTMPDGSGGPIVKVAPAPAMSKS